MKKKFFSHSALKRDKKDKIYILTENFATDDESDTNIIGAYRSKTSAKKALEKYKKGLFTRKNKIAIGWEVEAKEEWDEKKEEGDYEYEESETHFSISEKYNYKELHTSVMIKETTL